MSDYKNEHYLLNIKQCPVMRWQLSNLTDFIRLMKIEQFLHCYRNCVISPHPMPQGRDASESDAQKFFQGLEIELMCQNLPGCGDRVGFSSTVDFGLDVYPFIFQTSSRLFILAIPFQPETSHTLPSGTLSGFIPTAPALSRNLSGSPDPAKGPKC